MYQDDYLLSPGFHQFSIRVKNKGVFTLIVDRAGKREVLKGIALTAHDGTNAIHYQGTENHTVQRKMTKSGEDNVYLDFILGDRLVYYCYGDIHTTIYSDEPRGSKEYNVSFYPCVDADGKTYPAVVIGDQVWMAENLAYLPTIHSSDLGSNTDGPYYYVYGYEGLSKSEAKESANYQVYGVMYNWHAAMISCPEGWHLSTNEDWEVLETHLGLNEYELNLAGLRTSQRLGYKLKSVVNWLDDGNGSNEFGFNAQPSGWRMLNGGFDELGIYAGYWTSTISQENWSIGRYFRTESDGIGRGIAIQGLGYPVRCVKD